MRSSNHRLSWGSAAALLSILCAAAPAAAQSLDARAPAADTIPPVVVVDPVLTPNPNPRAPLAAIVTLRTDEPTQVELGLKDGERSWTVLAEPEHATDHEVLVLGVRADRTIRVQVTVRDAAGNATTAPNELSFTTPPLPALFPPLQLTAQVPGAMEPGITFFNATNDRFHPSYLIAVDEEGEVIWYFETDEQTSDARRLRNGNFLYIHNRFQVNELDLLGNVVGKWWAGGIWPDRAPDDAVLVATDTFHHEVGEMPSSEPADFVALSTELRTYPDYPANEEDQTQTNPTADVIGDVIVEFTREGTVVHQTSLHDVLDPYRVCYDSLGNFWNLQYALPDTEDWTHANAVVWDTYDEAYIVSARSQESVFKVRRDTAELVWIIGPHERWDPQWQPFLLTPTGAPFEWNYHQHAPEVQVDGNVLLFDNGNGRAVPPDPVLPWDLRYSRAVEYRVDAVNMTAEQVWSYGSLDPSEHFYSHTRGDADKMRTTGNVLVTDADRRPTSSSATSFARVFEVTTGSPPQIVYELYVRDLSPTTPRAWNVYRAERQKGIYPHQ